MSIFCFRRIIFLRPRTRKKSFPVIFHYAAEIFTLYKDLSKLISLKLYLGNPKIEKSINSARQVYCQKIMIAWGKLAELIQQVTALRKLTFISSRDSFVGGPLCSSVVFWSFPIDCLFCPICFHNDRFHRLELHM